MSPELFRVQSAVEVVEDQLGEEDTALQSKKKSVKKRPKRRPRRKRAEEEELEENNTGKAVSPPRPF